MQRDFVIAFIENDSQQPVRGSGSVGASIKPSASGLLLRMHGGDAAIWRQLTRHDAAARR